MQIDEQILLLFDGAMGFHCNRKNRWIYSPGFGLASRSEVSRRTAWEGRPQRVRAPYLKREVMSAYPEYHGTRGIRREVGGTILQA